MKSSSTRAIVGIKTCSVRATPHHLKLGKLGRSVSIPRQSHDSSKAFPTIRELWQWRKALAGPQKYLGQSGKAGVVARRGKSGEAEATHSWLASPMLRTPDFDPKAAAKKLLREGRGGA